MCKIYTDIGVTIMNTVVAEATRAVPVILKSTVKKQIIRTTLRCKQI